VAGLARLLPRNNVRRLEPRAHSSEACAVLPTVTSDRTAGCELSLQPEVPPIPEQKQSAVEFLFSPMLLLWTRFHHQVFPAKLHHRQPDYQPFLLV